MTLAKSNDNTDFKSVTSPQTHKPSPRLDFKDVLDRLDFQQWFEREHGPGKRRGKAREYNADIINRPEDTASLMIYANGYQDFGSGDGGSPYDFLMKYHGLSFPDALATFAEFVGLTTGAPLPKRSPKQHKPAQRTDDPPSAPWQSIAEAAIKDCERRLWSPAGAAALDYLHNRGLTDDTIRALRFGFNPTWIKTLWQKADGHFAQLAPGITIPWIADGHIWALKVRSLDPADDTKYRQLADGAQSAGLFNADAIQPGKPVLIVEGEFDAALIIQVAGDLVTPVTVGSASNTISDRWRAQLDQSPILLATDNDTAGNAARDRLTEQFPSALIAPALPDGIKDVTDLWKSGGDVRQWVIDALATATPALTALSCNQETAPELDDDTADTLESTSFLARCYDGLPDDWSAQFRRMGPPCELTAVIWIDAIRFGLHAAVSPVNAALLADYAVQLGLCQPAQRRNVYRTCSEGLDRLFEHGIIFTNQKLPIENTLNSIGSFWLEGETGFVFCTDDEVFHAIRTWEQSRTDQAAYGGYIPNPADGAPEPAIYPNLARLLTGEYGADETTADEIAADIDSTLTPRRNEVRQKFAQKRASDLLSTHLLRLSIATAVSPRADGFTFCNHVELSAARMLGKFQTDPTCRRWQCEQWAAFLGVSIRSLPTIRRAADLESHLEHEQLTLTSGNLEQQIRDFAAKVKGKPIKMEVIDTELKATYFEPYTMKSAAKHLAADRGVVVWYRVASRLEIAEQDEPTPIDKPARAQADSDTAAQVDTPEQPATPKPPVFAHYYGRGASKRFLWSQLILRLVRSGYAEDDINCLRLDDVIALARGNVELSALLARDRREPVQTSVRVDFSTFWDDVDDWHNRQNDRVSA